MKGKKKKKVTWGELPQKIKNEDDYKFEQVKFRLKGSRNKNNPIRDIERASEVRIVKQANYTDCLSCHFCIADNIYKVYNTDAQVDEPTIIPKDRPRDMIDFKQPR